MQDACGRFDMIRRVYLRAGITRVRLRSMCCGGRSPPGLRVVRVHRRVAGGATGPFVIIRPSGICFGQSPLGADNRLPEDYREEVPLMKTGMRILAFAVAFLMLVTGPLAPIAFAQQPSPVQPEPAAQPGPAPQQPPAPQPQPMAQQPTPQPEPMAQQPTPQPEPVAP